MASHDEKKPPAFFCPQCEQKHRADLSLLEERPDASVRTKCSRCGAAFRVRLTDGKPVCELVTVMVDGAEPLGKPVPPVRPPEVAETPAPVQPAVPVKPAVPPPVKPAARGPAPKRSAAPKPAPRRSARPSKEPEQEFAVGDRVGRYTIQGFVRQGVTSTVYRAFDPTTKRAVALKILLADAPQGVQHHFQHQVDVQAKIRHPNIVPVYDRGTLDDGRPFFAMELLYRPVTLGDLLSRRAAQKLDESGGFGPLVPIEGLVDKVLLPLADGLYVANAESGVLHGDLRPDNVLIDGRTHRPYLMDFGRASGIDDSGPTRGRSGDPRYRAPEQARGEVTARTDVWGLGAILFTMLSGRPPLEGRRAEVDKRGLEGHYGDLPDDAPPALVAVARKAMAPQSEMRYVNARQMAVDLKAWQKGGLVRAVDEFGGRGASAEGTRQAVRRHLRSARWALLGIALGLLVGSRIQLGGAADEAQRIRSAESQVNLLGRELTQLADALTTGGAPPSSGETTRLWEHLRDRAEGLETRVAAVGSGVVRRRLGYVRARCMVPEIRLVAAPGVSVEALNVGTGVSTALSTGQHVLPPGLYHVSGPGGLRFPALVPLGIRPSGKEPEADKPVLEWRWPALSDEVGAHVAYVPGGTVRAEDLPFHEPSEPVEIAPFLMERQPVSSARYAAFLAGLSGEDRDRRVPSVGFEVKEDGRVAPAAGRESQPVVGVSPDDAAAYCAWLARETGESWRLPRETEWVLTASGGDTAWATTGRAPWCAENPYGVQGLLTPPREYVIGVVGGLEEGEVLTKGAETSEADVVQALFDMELAGRRKDDQTGFRCVRDYVHAADE